MNETKKTGWGGARKGAGRRPLAEMKRTYYIHMRINAAEKAKIDEMRGKTPLAAFVRARLGL